MSFDLDFRLGKSQVFSQGEPEVGLFKMMKFFWIESGLRYAENLNPAFVVLQDLVTKVDHLKLSASLC